MLRQLVRVALPPILTSAFTVVMMLVLAASTGRTAQAGPRPEPPERESKDEGSPLREPIGSGVSASTSLSFTLTLSEVASGVAQPVYLTHAGDGSGRTFVVEQEGRIRVIKNGALLSTPFLSITDRVECCGEEGLLSVAFPPDYPGSRKFYVYYTNLSSNIVVARYGLTADPDVADPNSEQIVLTIDHPGQVNHNGGQLQFGPNDGYLYLGMGDGGGGGDPNNNAQSLNTLLGKILRIDVSGVPTYTIPSSNPFTQTTGARPEIWAYGLRNPWRFSFDRNTRDMVIGDVGQNAWEEVSYQPGSSAGGENYGWRIMEGLHCFNPSSGCDMTGLTLPVVEYGQSVPGEDNCSVTGGYVYRGSNYPWLNGVYFYADYCSGRIWALEQVSPGNWVSSEKRNEPFAISSFGEDEVGEVYVLDYSFGRVYKITSTAPIDLSSSAKAASDAAPESGSSVTYAIVLRNSGGAFAGTIRLTDTIPAGLIYQSGSLVATLGTPDDSSAPTLKWSGVMANTPVVTVTYAVTVSAVTAQTISNIVIIDPSFSAPFTRSATILVNPLRLYMPVILKN